MLNLMSRLSYQVQTLSNTDSEGNRNMRRIAKAKILMPFNALNLGISWSEFKKLITKEIGVTIDGIPKYAIDRELFKNIIAYRVPNKSISSNDSIEIIGLMPPYSSDVAIVYNEISLKTGSDLDRLYFMMPSFEVYKDRLIDREDRDLRNELTKLDFPIIPTIRSLMDNQEYSYYEIFYSIIIQSQEAFDFLKLKGYTFTKIKIGEQYLNILENDSPLSVLINYAEKLVNFISKIDLVLFDNRSKIKSNTLLIVMKDLIRGIDKKNAILKQLLKDYLITRKSNQQAINSLFKNEVTTIEYVSDNSYKGQQNKLIRLYLSILENEHTYKDLMTPFNSSTLFGLKSFNEEIVNTILLDQFIASKLPKGMKVSSISSDKRLMFRNEMANASENTQTILSEYSPVTKILFEENKRQIRRMVEIIANNRADISYSQIFEVAIKHDSFKFRNNFTNEVVFKLSNKFSQIRSNDYENNLITQTSMQTWLLNSIEGVDNECLSRSNLNTITAYGAFLMIRIGLSPYQVFNILMHSVVKDFIKDRQSKFSNLTDLRIQKEANIAAISLLSIIKRHPEFDFNKEFSCDAILINQDVFNLNMDTAILGLWSIIEELGKALIHNIKFTKPDSNGSGLTIGAQMALLNIKELVLNEKAIYGSFEKMAGMQDGISQKQMYAQLSVFNINIPHNFTALGAIHNSGLMLTTRVLEDISLEGSKGYRNLINDVALAFGENYPIKINWLNILNNKIYTFLLYKVYNPSTFLESSEEHILNSKGRNALKRKIFEIIVKDKAKYQNNNMFYQQLMTNSSTSYISLESMNIATEIREMYKMELSQLEYVDPNAVERLLQYSLLQNGLRPNRDGLLSVIPVSTFIKAGIGNRLESIRKAWNKGDYNTPFLIRDIESQVDLNQVVMYISADIDISII